ncbi:protein transport protein SEC31 [Pancytospora epiphaga]|nr:protein transport protein SEC31 [Pancytospora epiphaga]
MIINKSCISAFSRTRPFVALATKSKLFDPSFSLTSELILANYMTGKVYPPTTTDLKFCKLLWCETEAASYLVSGHENGVISLYELTEEGLVLVRSNEYMDGDVTALEYLPSKSVLVAGSSNGKIIFWTLTDLDKEYKLDIPISAHITAIAWNAKVPKILCVGTADGSIKVLDIKKNSVIMTLSNKDITEVRAMEWDSTLSTKLLVMSDRPYLTIFDLSTDSVTHVGNHPDSLIGFKDDILASKNVIEKGDTKINIKETFDISFSPRDSVVAVSYADGTTEVLSIPVMPRRMPFFRRRHLIFTLGAVSAQKGVLTDIDTSLVSKKIILPKEASENGSEGFYKEMVKMVRESKSNTDIAQFLLEKAAGAEEDSEASITVDLNDDEILSIVKGDLEFLKDSRKNVALCHIYAVLTGKVENLRNIDDLAAILVLSKIANDYSSLVNIKNSRILAAIALFHDILRDPSLYTNACHKQEFIAICSLVSKDFGKYIDSRMGLCEYHLGNLGNVNHVMLDLGDFVTGDVKLTSQCLVDYFWYKVFQGEYDDVKDLNIIDEDVEYYNRVMQGHIDQITNATSNLGKTPTFTSTVPRFTRVTESRIDREGTSVWPGATGVPITPSQVTNNASIYNQPQDYSGRQVSKAVPAPFASKISAGPVTPVGGCPVQPAVQQRPVIPAPSKVRPEYSPVTHKATLKSPNMIQPNFSFPSGSMRSSITRPPAGVVPPAPASMGYPPVGIPSKTALEGFSRQKSSGANAVPMPSVKPVSTLPYSQIPTALEQLHVTNTQISTPVDAVAIVKRFDSLVSMIRERAAAKNSLIIKQRKNQHLNALGVYDTINKSAIPVGVLETMDTICLRMETPDITIKSDIDAIVSKQNDCIWLKAFSDLVKLLY